MRSSRFALAFALLSFSSLSNATLLFSEYVEGSSYNKALEIFNPGVVVDFSIDNYVVDIYTNGASAPRYSVGLSGILGSEDTFVLGHSSAGVEITSTANLLSSSINFNGDDAITLSLNGTIVDRIGQIGMDPGSEWGAGLNSTQNNTLRRLPGIDIGDVNALLEFDPSQQWLGFATDDFSGLGNHEIISAASEPGEENVSVPLPASSALIAVGLLPLLLNGAMRRQREQTLEPSPLAV